jgi:hypothetical protein
MGRHDEEWYTKPEIAAWLKVSTRTVVRLGLPFHRVGRQNRYFKSEVEMALSGTQEAVDNVVPLRPRSKGAAA